MIASVLLGTLALSFVLTARVRRYALSVELLDHPNARSSHTVPTPRGGGVAIVASCLLAVLGLAWADQIDRALSIAVLGSGLLVASLGFADDRGGLTARLRFAGHAVAAAWVLFWIGKLPAVPIFGAVVDLSYAGFALSAIYLVWMVNLFNFMDGIDGIASVEAITTTLGGAALWWLAGSGTGWIVAVVLAACVGGFLVWNFPPAKIFMGDAGSGFLGLMVGTLSLWCGQTTPALFWAWLILVGCFMVDATTTLVRRVLRGEVFYEAHRSHAYQYASRRAGGHLPVTLACGTINVLWLLPIATAVALGRIDGVLGVLIAYLPLVALAYRYKAGDGAAQAAALQDTVQG